MDQVSYGWGMVVDDCIRTGKPIPKPGAGYYILLATALILIGYIGMRDQSTAATAAVQNHSVRGR